jgi:putative PIN family toxin of toxin-antitoxin system
MTVVAVFDCMLFVQAAANPNGAAMACFDRLTQSGGRLCLSDDVLLEIGEVLSRPELRRRLPSLTPARVGRFLDDIRAAATMIDVVPHAFSLPRDSNDQPYLDLAIAANADFLVTWNARHLTYLMGQDTPEGREFCRRYPDLTIVDPVQFLRVVVV